MRNSMGTSTGPHRPQLRMDSRIGQSPRISASMPFRDLQWSDILRQMRVRNAIAQ